jgi:peptidoglycan-associated lipoprotein
MRGPILFCLAAGVAASAGAQLPGLRRYTPADHAKQQQAAPVAQGIEAERAEFAAQAGGTTVYFGASSALLGAPAKTVLTAQAAWLRRHPEVVVRVEGYGDTGDTTDHAIAVGARRASAARDYLLLMGIPAAQVATASWGKERAGLGRAVTILVR